MSTTKEIKRINDLELNQGIPLTASWHSDWKHTNWIFCGNLDYSLSEGDVISVFSQYGEVEDFHLVRDEETGKSKGFCFLKYEDWRSTVLAIDNFNSSELLGRVLRVDHANYSRKKLKKNEEEQLTIKDKYKMQQPGVRYNEENTEGKHSLQKGQNIFDSQ
eukprot:augustus_masked-scaffold_7-processed-gene-14.51-mRNA-1 protein AED:0.02 eAED:0.02 QI:0/-1/0/1/-1/1/1/0/160